MIQDLDWFETPIVANPQSENYYCRDHVLFEFNSFHRMAQLLHINRPSANVCIAKSCNMGHGLVHHMTRCEYDYVHVNMWEDDNNIGATFHSQLPRGKEHATWLFLLCWVIHYFDMMSYRIFFCHIIISYGHMARPYSWHVDMSQYYDLIWMNFYSEVRQQKHKI